MSIIEEQGAQAVGFGLASVAYTALGEGESAESAGLTFPRPNKRPSLGPGGEGGRRERWRGDHFSFDFFSSAGLPYWLPAVAGRRRRSLTGHLLESVQP